MEANFVKSLNLVLVNEGGWSDHPQDPGGATMKGVTLEVFRRYYGADRTKDHLRNITDEQLQHIYRTGYWDKCCCDDLASGLDFAVFDAAVNSGPGRSAKWLQAAVGVTQDGAIGPGTLQAVASHDPVALIGEVLDLRLKFLQGLSTWSTFGGGWGKRVNTVRAEAMAMAGETLHEESANSATESAPVAAATDYEVVRRGSTGEWVKKVQTAIGVNADGAFGAQTEAALKTWQADHGLTADGVAGRGTYRAMGLIA